MQIKVVALQFGQVGVVPDAGNRGSVVGPLVKCTEVRLRNLRRRLAVDIKVSAPRPRRRCPE